MHLCGAGCRRSRYRPWRLLLVFLFSSFGRPCCSLCSPRVSLSFVCVSCYVYAVAFLVSAHLQTCFVVLVGGSEALAELSSTLHVLSSSRGLRLFFPAPSICCDIPCLVVLGSSLRPSSYLTTPRCLPLPPPPPALSTLACKNVTHDNTNTTTRQHNHQGNPAADEAGGGLSRAVPPGQRGRLPAGGRAAVHLRPRGPADGHVPLQVPPHAPDSHVQGACRRDFFCLAGYSDYRSVAGARLIDRSALAIDDLTAVVSVCVFLLLFPNGREGWHTTLLGEVFRAESWFPERLCDCIGRLCFLEYLL